MCDVSSFKIINEINTQKNNTSHTTPKCELASTAGTINFEQLDLNYQPLFLSISWHVKLEADERLQIDQIPAFRLAKTLHTSMLTMLHFNCYRMTPGDLLHIGRSGVQNLFVLRGDAHDAEQEFQHASTIVSHIRDNISQTVCIGVAGYPETHPDAISPEIDLQFLKYKMDCGSDFIITQICFDLAKIVDFIKRCRAVGIEAPIIPGIYQPKSYEMLMLVCDFCKVLVPAEILKKYETLKDDAAEFDRVAHNMTVELVRGLLGDGAQLNIPGVHFFTFNHIKPVVDVVRECADIFEK